MENAGDLACLLLRCSVLPVVRPAIRDCLLIILIVDLLEFAAFDSFANLLRCFMQLGHLISVERLLNAGCAIRSMSSFKAAMQAVMPVASVAVAVTRQSID